LKLRDQLNLGKVKGNCEHLLRYSESMKHMAKAVGINGVVIEAYKGDGMITLL
jgi:hypothetical protein